MTKLQTNFLIGLQDFVELECADLDEAAKKKRPYFRTVLAQHPEI